MPFNFGKGTVKSSIRRDIQVNWGEKEILSHTVLPVGDRIDISQYYQMLGDTNYIIESYDRLKYFL